MAKDKEGLPRTGSLIATNSRDQERLDLQIRYVSTTICDASPHFVRYRTLSIHVEDKKPAKSNLDPATAIRQIDTHTLAVDEVFTRFSTSPTLGLENSAVTRLQKAYGKNVISPPKTQYWKKILNYIFGGFNFLMWIAFIVTIVSHLV